MTDIVANENKWLFNVLFNVFLKQLTMTVAYFIPYILLELIISMVTMFLGKKEDEKPIWKTAVEWVVNIVMLYTVNAMVLRTGMLFPKIALQLLEKYDFSAGIGSLIIMLVPVLLFIFAAIRDIITSDTLIAILGVSITVSMMGITIHDENRLYIFAVALVCSLIARLIRSLTTNKDEVFKWEAIAALITLIGTALISWLIFSL